MMQPGYQTYLYFGYLPNISEAHLNWLAYDAEDEPRGDVTRETWWIDQGVKALKETLANQLAGTKANATHVIPLSGGLDSRAILGGLLENLPGSQIATITYGIPGAWDYELSRLVARKAGVRHEVMDLQDEEWDLNQLIATGACLENPADVFEAHVRRKMSEHFGPSCVFWSGFLAGSLAGVHLPEVPSSGKAQAIQRFLKNNRTAHYRDQDGTLDDEMARAIEENFPWAENALHWHLGIDQQLDYGIRHQFYIRTVVMVKGFDYQAPFIHKTWLNYIFRVPYKWLLHEYMYKQVLQRCYPELFRLPVRNNAGLPLTYPRSLFLLSKLAARVKPWITRRDIYRSHPRTNYMNFTEALRHKTRFQDLVYAMLQDLIRGEIFPRGEIEQWWAEHIKKKADHTVLLLNLASLEILRKSESI